MAGGAVELPEGVELVLASASPRRRDLLASAGLTPTVRPADVDETPMPGEDPGEYVARLSRSKAAAVGSPGAITLAADTTVDVDGAILEKPVDDADAERMLRLLSGRSHRVRTGVTVAAPDGRDETQVVTTVVAFVELTDEAIAWYVASGDARDKAGAYAIQGGAAGFVERVEGSVTNVVGLPLAESLAMLRRAATG